MGDKIVSPLNSAPSVSSPHDGKGPDDGKFADALQQARAVGPDVAQTDVRPAGITEEGRTKSLKKEAEEIARQLEEEGDKARTTGNFREAASFYKAAVEVLNVYKRNDNDAEQDFKFGKPGIGPGV
jgi:hypothetical protein